MQNRLVDAFEAWIVVESTDVCEHWRYLLVPRLHQSKKRITRRFLHNTQCDGRLSFALDPRIASRVSDCCPLPIAISWLMCVHRSTLLKAHRLRSPTFSLRLDIFLLPSLFVYKNLIILLLKLKV